MTMRLSAILALALAAAACDVRVNDKGISLDVSEGGRAEDESTQSYPLAPGGRIEFETGNANVNIVPAAGTAVEIHTRRQAQAKTDEAARELLKEPSSTVEATPQVVTVRSVKPAGGELSRSRVRVNYRIGVPAGATVSIRNENGMVRFEDIVGTLTVRSTNGRIEGQNVSGGVDFETVNGSVFVRMATVTSDVRIRTVNGGVVLRLPVPNTVNATVDAAAVNGGVSVDDALPLKAATKDHRRVTGALGTGRGPRIELQTTNGGVRLDGEVRRD